MSFALANGTAANLTQAETHFFSFSQISATAMRKGTGWLWWAGKRVECYLLHPTSWQLLHEHASKTHQAFLRLVDPPSQPINSWEMVNKCYFESLSFRMVCYVAIASWSGQALGTWRLRKGDANLEGGGQKSGLLAGKGKGLRADTKDPFVHQRVSKHLSEGLWGLLVPSPSLWEARFSSYTSVKMTYHNRLKKRMPEFYEVRH